MTNHYPIGTQSEIESFLSEYAPKVVRVGQRLGLDLLSQDFQPDHLGLQVVSAEEFYTADTQLQTFTTVVLDEVIHNRRNRVYEFLRPLQATIPFPRIEMFEPTPKYELNIQVPGIQHSAFVVPNLPAVIHHLESRHMIARDRTYSLGRFVKTKIQDGIEIEFRESPLTQNT